MARFAPIVARRAQRPRRDQGSGVVAAVGVLLLVIGAGLGAWGWQMSADAKESKTWPIVSGTVTSSKVAITQDAEDGSDQYQAKVSYRYEVDGETYRGSRIAFGVHNSADKGAAERTVARYPEGEPADVAYDPDDHGRAVLEPGEDQAAIWVQLAGGATGLAGLAMVVGGLVAAIRRRNRPVQVGPDSLGDASTDQAAHPFGG